MSLRDEYEAMYADFRKREAESPFRTHHSGFLAVRSVAEERTMGPSFRTPCSSAASVQEDDEVRHMETAQCTAGRPCILFTERRATGLGQQRQWRIAFADSNEKMASENLKAALNNMCQDSDQGISVIDESAYNVPTKAESGEVPHGKADGTKLTTHGQRVVERLGKGIHKFLTSEAGPARTSDPLERRRAKDVLLRQAALQSGNSGSDSSDQSDQESQATQIAKELTRSPSLEEIPASTDLANLPSVVLLAEDVFDSVCGNDALARPPFDYYSVATAVYDGPATEVAASED